MAVILLAIALYHTAALTIPAFAGIAYPANYPPLRHIVFILTNIVAAWLFLSRPRWMLWPVLILVAQAFYSHGGHAVQTWQRNRQIDWVDPTVIAITLFGLTILCLDRLHTSPTQIERE